MAHKRPALGRGLSALIPDEHLPSAERVPRREAHPREVDIDLLSPNRFQPRGPMDEERLDELAQSIRANGVVQPIVVRARGDRFEIVAGERRWRAAQRAGLLKVPVAVRDFPDDKMLEIALIENLQREDLNPIEEAQAYKRLADDFHLKQEEIAAAVGKDRSSIANTMRLLRLPAEVRHEVAAATLSMGHARALLALPDEAAQLRLSRESIARGLSVRDLEALVKKSAAPAPEPAAPAPTDVHTRAAEERLKFALGTRVRIVRRGGRGRIEIDFGTEDELQRLYEHLSR